MADRVIVSVSRGSLFTRSGTAIVGLESLIAPIYPAISVADAQGNEGTVINVRVTITAITAQDVTFGYTTVNGSAIAGVDYTAVSGTGTIPAGSLFVDIPITTVDEDGFTGPKSLSFNISSAVTNGVNLTITDASAQVTILDTDQPTGDHGYFDSLVARGDHWKSFSWRNQALVNQWATGSSNLSTIYDPINDTDPNAQDAVKLTIPPFGFGVSFQAYIGPSGIDASQLSFPIYENPDGTVLALDATVFNAKGTQIKIGDEIVLSADNNPYDRPNGILNLKQRGAYGTTATSHAVGTGIQRGGSSLQTQIRPDINTVDGNVYLFTWDVMWTNSWLRCNIGTMKAFQLSSNQAIWLEPQIRYGGSTPEGQPVGFNPDLHVGIYGGCRSYNNVGGTPVWSDNVDTKTRRLGPICTNNNPLAPALPNPNPFMIVYPNRWVRTWMRIDQRANDYDYFDMWVADEVQEPIQVYQNIPVNVRGKWANNAHQPPDTINKWYAEFDTSNSYIADGITQAWPSLGLAAFRDLVVYTKNLVVLLNPPTDISSLLIKPT